MTQPGYVPVFSLWRGETLESLHYGAAAVVDSTGRLLAAIGDPFSITYLRSTAKPFQALPFVELGGMEHYGFSPRELALMCASHSGTDAHVETARRIQELAGLSEADLLCGVHPPTHQPTAEALRARGESPTPNRHNCSGKHSGMLAFARLIDAAKEDYINPRHPVQQAILIAFAEMCGLPVEEVRLGTDGCSAPNFAVPLYHAALAYARLCDPQVLNDEPRAAACRKLTDAMLAHPDMVGGPERFDTLLMQTGGGRILTKGGAEGYTGIGVLPGALGAGSPGIGIALKVSDGDPGSRARPAVALELLRRLGAVTEDQLAALSRFGPRLPVYNWRKLEVGWAEPVFDLQTEGLAWQTPA